LLLVGRLGGCLLGQKYFNWNALSGSWSYYAWGGFLHLTLEFLGRRFNTREKKYVALYLTATGRRA